MECTIKKGLFIVWCLVLQNKKLDTTTTSKLLCKQISNCKRECEQLRSRKIHSSPQFSPSKNFSACLSACPEKVKLVVKSLFLPPGQKSPSHMPGGLALSWAGLKCMIAILQTLTIHSFHFFVDTQINETKKKTSKRGGRTLSRPRAPVPPTLNLL